MRKEATSTPTALDSITEDTAYSIQNSSESSLIFVSVASSAPNADEPDFKIPPLGFLVLEAGSGESIYVWHPGSDNDFHVGYQEAV